MTNQKFQINQKVRAKNGKVFVINWVYFNKDTNKILYSGRNALEAFKEEDLTEYRDPMRVEFETEVEPLIHDSLGYHTTHVYSQKLKPLLGKKVRVTVEEVL